MVDQGTIIDVFSLLGIPGLTEAWAKFIAEGAIVCLEDQGHRNITGMLIVGDCNENCSLSWRTAPDIEDSWQDKEQATEFGAYGIAILIVVKLMGFERVQRSYKGTGFDFWVGNNAHGFLFQNKTKLEVSGILKGASSDISSREKKKVDQVRRFETNRSPAIIIIVEFGAPQARVKKL